MARVIVGVVVLLMVVLGSRPTPAVDGSVPEDADLRRLYGTGVFTPIWIDEKGELLGRARDALELLGDAASHGLNPAEYDAARLETVAAAIEAARHPSTEDVAAFDRLLSRQLLRYFRHLHLGRVDPRSLGIKLTVPADPHDFVQVLRDTVAGNGVAAASMALAPPLAQYRALRSMLARYRTLAAGENVRPLPSLSGSLHPGDDYPGLTALHDRLALLGDLPGGGSPPIGATTYTGDIVEAVSRFQARHGLDPDGVLGTKTVAALDVPLTGRVRQIELALERLRWLPDLGERRFIGLNIPMFQLWGWDSIPPDGSPSFGMRAIVGRAAVTQTPIFVDEMDHLIFRPYWNVPRSILLGEILPSLRRNPSHPSRADFEIVAGEGDRGPILPPTAENIARLGRGELRLRQRPGPNNALGLVKFVFPNDDNVYMHGTPAQELFSRARRDFSHGCVRVEDPAALAEWALKDQPGWTRERIVAAMTGAETRRVDLAQPVQVILFYLTAVVIPEDGTLHFAEDIYGHDRRLDRALANEQTRKEAR